MMFLNTCAKQGASLPMLRMPQPDAEPNISAVPRRLLHSMTDHQLSLMMLVIMSSLHQAMPGYICYLRV